MHLNQASLLDPTRFELIAQVDHDDMVPFVLKELGRSNPVIRFFYGINIAGAVWVIAWSIWQIWHGMVEWTYLLGNFFLGLLFGSTVIIPIHEALHGLGYWLSGARKIRFGGNWRKMYWYAVADQWVLTGIRYCLIALLPFFFITFVGILALFFVSPHHFWLLAGVILMHALNCAGDFAVVGFCWEHRDRLIYTFDQLSTRQSFFYKTKGESSEQI